MGSINFLYVGVRYKDGKGLLINEREVNLTGVGVRGQNNYISVSPRLVKRLNGLNVVEVERLNAFTGVIRNTQVVLIKGAIMITYKEGSNVYLIEIPSGIKGLNGVSGSVRAWSGRCIKTSIAQVVLLDPRRQIGEVLHLWCNDDEEISVRYTISGDTSLASYKRIEEWFRPSLEGIIRISRGVVTVHSGYKAWGISVAVGLVFNAVPVSVFSG